MAKKLHTSKSAQWIKQGAPEQALSFLGETVDKLNDIAVEKQIVFKGTDEMENEVKTEVTPEVTEPVAEETKTEEVKEEVVTKEEPNVMEVIQKGIVDSISVALKEYNDTVIAPLQAQIAELQASLKAPVTKEYGSNVFFGANEFMPAAAVAAMIKKEFNLNTDTPAKTGDVEVNPEEVKTVVVKKEISAPVVDKNNVLAGF